ncbi:MAG: phosphotransferase, partial [Acidimicrobiales bacterium]
MLDVPRSWSELTPDWMTGALARDFPGAVVSELLADDITEGTNDRARVRLGYRSGNGPERVFVKREGSLVNRLALLALGAVQNEARFLASGAPLPLEHPAPYAVATRRRRLATVVVMEDVTTRAGRPNDLTAGLSVGQVHQGLDGLARLHGQSWDRPLPPSLRFLRPWRLGRVWAPVSLGSLTRAVRLLRSRGRAELLPSGVRVADLERGFRRWASIAATRPLTVLHGDPHPGNTYALSGERIGFYDWQLVRTGNWSHDVGYFIVSS